MVLSDIITTYSDRLFFVDPECFIIFTGESIHDDKPFIRIGTWPEMPAELIPFIENIIVPDGMIGNPAFEQFNIDVRSLENNRYIGSENILQRFLNYQKLFGLDLTNAHIVNIEKDIPELTSEKTVSEKNQFIGVFYRNGNFKTVHGSRDIFNLEKARETTASLAGIDDLIAERALSSQKYLDSGILILENNPLFFNDGAFTSYLFPSAYLSSFSRLQISPEKVKAVIHPSSNYMNLTRFVKWKARKTGQLTLISDNSDETSLLKGLFRNCTISQLPFEGMHYESGDGVSFSQYRDSYNIRIDYRKTDIHIAFIKGAAGIQEVLHDDLDAILIEYSIYEESVLLFKSTSIPVILINDTGNSISHRLNDTLLTARQEIPCSFMKPKGRDELIPPARLSEEVIAFLQENNTEALGHFFKELIDREERGDEENMTLHNGYNLLRSFADTAEDRDIFNRYRAILQDLRRALLHDFSFQYRQIFCFLNQGVYSFIEPVPESNPADLVDEIRVHDENSIAVRNIDPHQSHALDKIIYDRRRLRLLIRLLLEKQKSRGTFDEESIYRLEDAIEIRKKYYNHDIPETEASYENRQSGKKLSHFLGGRKKISGEPGASNQDKERQITDAETSVSTSGNGLDTSTKKLPPNSSQKKEGSLSQKRKATLAVSAVALLAAFIFLFSYQKSWLGSGSTASTTKKEVVSTKSSEILTDTQKKQYEKLPAAFKSDITDTDIYRYANKVALKNGYAAIKFKDAKVNNPHWIFPKNHFTLLDEEKITVAEGDTLWAIAKKKLIEMDINFYVIIKEAETKEGSPKNELLEKAAGFSFSAKHQTILNKTRARTLTE